MGKGPSKTLWLVAIGFAFFSTWLGLSNTIVPLDINILGVPIRSPNILAVFSVCWAGVAIGMFFAEFSRRKQNE